MTNTLKEQDAADIRYFWTERGEVERWVGWDGVLATLDQTCPLLAKSYRDYIAAKEMFDLVVRSL